MKKLINRAKVHTHRLLRKSEKYFKTDMVYLAKGGFWVAIGQVATSLSIFTLAVAFAHFVSKETYGEYKYILSLAGIFGAFTLTGIGTAVTQSVTQGYDGTLKYAFWQNIKWSVLYFALTLAVSIYYFARGNTSLGFSMLIIGSFSPFLSSSNLYGSFLVAKKDFRRATIYFEIIGTVFPVLCLLTTMQFTNKPLWFVLVYFASNTLIGIILYLRIIYIYRPNNKVDPGALTYGKHLSLLNILNIAVTNLDQVLVFHYLGPVQLAVYNFAIAIPSQVKGPMKSLDNLLFPKFVERTDKEIKAGMNHKIFYLFLVLLSIAVAYIFSAPYIFQVLFPQYSSSVLYSRILILSIFGLMFTPMNTYLVTRKKIKEQYIFNIIASAAQIIAIPLSIIYGGLMGLVITRVVLRLTANGMTAFLYHQSISKATTTI